MTLSSLRRIAFGVCIALCVVIILVVAARIALDGVTIWTSSVVSAALLALLALSGVRWRRR